MVSIKIDSTTIPVQLGTEFILDGTEEFDFGRLVIPKSLQRLPYDDFASVELTINGTVYEAIIQKDMVNKVANGIWKHTITLGEVVLKLGKHIAPDRKFTTYDGNKITYLDHADGMINLTFYGKTIPYIIHSDTQTLLNSVDADEREYVGMSLLASLTQIFRSVDAIPTLSLDGVIGHKLINEFGSLITLPDDTGEVLTADIGDYALSVHTKVKNGTYESDLAGGGTYYPGLGYGITPRSANTKYTDSEAEWHIDSGIRRIILAEIKNLQSVSSGTITNADIAEWIVSKDEWDNLEIERDRPTLVQGKYQNNTLYFTEGDFRIKNAGVRYLNSSVPVLGEQAIDNLIRSYWVKVNGNHVQYSNQSIRAIEIEFFYQSIRDSEVRQERHALNRTYKESVMINNQQDSVVELSRLGNANKQLINRVGNYSFDKTYRYYDSDTPVFYELNDYTEDGYRIAKIKYLLRNSSYDITYGFVEKQSILNPITSVNQSVSPFTITKKNVLTNPIYENYIEFSNVKATDNADIQTYLTFRKILFNMLNFSSTYDTPIYNCQYLSSDSDTLSDYLNMSVQRIPMGNSFQFNAQFKSPILAGYQLVDDTGYLGKRLKPIAYANPNGQVDNARFYFGHNPTIVADTHPVGAQDTNWVMEIPIEDFNLNPDEIMGITAVQHCVSRNDNLIIGDYFLKNNSLMKTLGLSTTNKLYYYAQNPRYTTEDKYAKGTPSGTGSISISANYESILVSGVPNGYSWAWVRDSGDELYMAYNSDGTDFTVIYNNLVKNRTDKESL